MSNTEHTVEIDRIDTSNRRLTLQVDARPDVDPVVVTEEETADGWRTVGTEAVEDVIVDGVSLRDINGTPVREVLSGP